MAVTKNKRDDERELGFGTKNYSNTVRFLNRDGKVNVRRTGMGWISNTDIYHWLISAPYSHLIFIIIGVYVIINTVFAGVYFMIGPEYFGGLEVANGSNFDEFMGLFFFSAQTITTLGYGHIYPIGNAASIAAAVESLLGLLSFAVATGILYGRFSRPKAHVLYSDNMLISPYMGSKGIMFRITNKKQYELIEVEATVNVTINNPETGRRDFFNLKLEINRINFLALSWTIVHHINEDSPLAGLTKQDMKARDIEFIILIRAINDTYSQTVYSRNSYKADELVENAKFKPLVPEAGEMGTIKISVQNIHLYDVLE
jgi:inward rectifier potassium channel